MDCKLNSLAALEDEALLGFGLLWLVAFVINCLQQEMLHDKLLCSISSTCSVNLSLEFSWVILKLSLPATLGCSSVGAT